MPKFLQKKYLFFKIVLKNPKSCQIKPFDIPGKLKAHKK